MSLPPNLQKPWVIACASLVVGIGIGAFLFADVRTRPIWQLKSCDDCYMPSELTGLLTSVAIQHVPGIVPSVVLETDKTVIIVYPIKTPLKHYVAFPKKDIKDVGDMSPEDREYLIDAYAAMAELVRREKLRDYRIGTNGAGLQDIRYLHFHLYEVDPNATTTKDILAEN